MSDRDSGPGFFGVLEALLAIVGALTVMGVLAVAASVLAWAMELRRREQETSLDEASSASSEFPRQGMRVILKTEVKGLGRAGDVKDVADGSARHYLLPK